MAQTSDLRTGIKPDPLVVSRSFPAAREQVFAAWSSAEHLKRWFSPEGCSVPEATVEFRPGGVFAYCMSVPGMGDFWFKGHWVEIVPPDRLVFAGRVSTGGSDKFAVHTIVTFETASARTLMSVHQNYEIFDESFGVNVAGAAEGWRTTLDKLERELARLAIPAKRSVAHGSFTLTRTYEAAPATVFHALTDPAAKARWFSGDETYVELERSMDARSGGRERLRGRWASGLVSTFDALYYDVVPNERLVYAYEMHLDDRKISVSIATMELKPAGVGTKLTVTEQGAFLDGYDDAGSREHGTGFLLDKLGASLRG